jgi:hypothetical protein
MNRGVPVSITVDDGDTGSPVEDFGVRCVVTDRGPTPLRREFPQSWNPETDDAGGFDLTLWPGEFQLSVNTLESWLRDRRPFLVEPGATQGRTVALEGSPVDLRLLAPNGKTPVAGVWLSLEETQSGARWMAPASDADGRVRIELLSTGLTFHLSAIPKHLQSQEAQDEHWWQHGRGPELARFGSLSPKLSMPTVDLILPSTLGY